MRMPIITVFGGTGFVGKAIVAAAARRGWIVRVGTRLEAKAGGCRQVSGVGQVVPFEIDYSDEASIRRACDGADYAVNCIGILYERGKKTFQHVHVELAAALAKQASQAGVRQFVHISALGCEQKQSHYARSKMDGEEAVHKAFPSAIVLRPSLIFGAGDSFFNMMAGLMRFAPFMPLIGGGQTKFQPVYVEDVAKAALQAIDEGKAQTYELAGLETRTLEELLLLVRTLSRRHTYFVKVPFWYAKMKAAFLGLLPKPLLTMDQVDTLKADSVANGYLPGFAALGIAPVPPEDILPLYLSRYIAGGPDYA